MSVNSMGFEQVSTLLNTLHQQNTGKAALGGVNTSNFVTIAQETLAAGRDPLLSSIMQMVSKTIFSNRPYRRKFRGLEADATRWGAIVRKENLLDKDFIDNEAFKLVDGASVDMFKVRKPDVVETVFTGFDTYSREYTIFKNQLDNAFTGPEELGSFFSMIVQNASDNLEQSIEATSRMTVASAIAGKIDMNETTGIIHLLTEYNAATGLSLTATTVYQPANFKPFMQWVYARIANLSDMMEERTNLFQFDTTATDGRLNRHTPKEDQRIFIYSPKRHEADMMAIADVYHDSFLSQAITESVTYWQAIKTPDSIQVTPPILTAAGAVTTGNAVSQAKIFGVMFDRDAMGVTIQSEETATSPYNISGKYWNTNISAVKRYWIDYTEKIIVLLLD